MEVKKLNLPNPVKYHPTHDVNDSSKIQAFQDCPRGFFFRYVMGLKKDEPNVHLTFGSAWHEAMEHIMWNGLGKDSLMDAYTKFEEIYMEDFPDAMAHDRKKNPENALRALATYAKTYRGYDTFDVLFTEIAGTVPVRQDRVIHTKVDTIIEDNDGIWSLEHKTTGRNSKSFRTKWNIKIQVGTYTHLVHALASAHFPNKTIQGVKINGAVIRTNDEEFLRIPVRKSSNNLQQFLWEVNHWIDQIEWNFKQLAECSREDDVMTCFPKNAESCSKFGCKYPGMCEAWDNPLKHLNQPPPGYTVEFWDPRKRNEEEASYVAKPDETGKLTLKKKTQKHGTENT